MPQQPIRPVSSSEPLAATGLSLTGLYFLSGIPALIYQTVWQRLMVLHSGVGTISVAIIVSVYMLGIGLGSLMGAGLSRRLTATQSLACFAALEFAIGLCGLMSPHILYDTLYLQYGSMYAELWRACLLHLAVLIVPTTLMGATLPLMTRALVSSAETAAGTVGVLYGMNTLGAACGALVAPWILMPLFGVRGAIICAAALNLLIAIIFLWGRSRQNAARQVTLQRDLSPAAPCGHPQPPVSGLEAETAGLTTISTPMWMWMLLYFLSGLCAIGLEMIWFRVLDIAVKSTAFTFGTVLGTYLLWLGLGSLHGASRTRHIRTPLKSFVATQCVILLSSGFIVLLLVRMPVELPGYAWFTRYWAEGPLRPSAEQLLPTFNLYVLLPAILMAAPAWLMGYSFCLLQKGVQTDALSSGYRVGLLQAANILGCTLGSLVTGLWLLGAFGSMTTLRILMVSGLVFSALGFRIGMSSRSCCGFISVSLLLLWALPDNAQLWLRLHGQSAETGAVAAEDVTGVCLLAPVPDSSDWCLWASGKPQSLLPFGGFHTRLGVMPATLHPQPTSVAIIGLGSGNTGWAAACRTETEQVTIFEICTPEVQLLELPFAQKKWPQVRQLMNDPRVRIEGRDARFGLMTSTQTYDVIEADAIGHYSAFAGYLYSVEFFDLCRRRLKSGGFMCSWSPTPLVHATFRRAFPHVLELESGILLIGSNDPIEVDLAGWQERIRSASGYLTPTMIEECLNSSRGARHVPAPQPDEFVNTDLFPWDEFN